MDYEASFLDTISILRCVSCGKSGDIVLCEGHADFSVSFPLHDKFLSCLICSENYPVTKDFIPIIWSDNLKAAFSGINPLEGNHNISANLEVYEGISDDYERYTRKNYLIGERIRSAVSVVLPSGDYVDRFHLDYACGPGHVLKWLNPLGFKQFGLDVSLLNLRNARRNTGCAVVCGDASDMPFSDNIFSLVTESSGLHHIEDWQSVLLESCRVCAYPGGVILDSEPSKEKMAWSPLAVWVFNLRFIAYRFLSYFLKSKYIFRNTEQAKLNLLAEIHHQPGTGFPVNKLRDIFLKNEFMVDIVFSPLADLSSKANPGWKSILLNMLSFRNPWNPNYGLFIAVAKRNRPLD
ncbi:class I SAM-dependent methyltransferase [Zhongshania sp.]|jgi:ubiquinone/menaquinone biosynthesis C-methylase UbiE|uniref:class I SAM-dependent methyltransferase n=1 Tax=Zhongshania sp. TaxID=1971902 RepID=UPI0039E2C09A